MPRSFRNPVDGNLHIQITQGELHVTNDPDHVLTTILGSCVAACIRDPIANIGGMNHFLLPKADGSDRGATDYGVNAMRVLEAGRVPTGAEDQFVGQFGANGIRFYLKLSQTGGKVHSRSARLSQALLQTG